CGEPLYFCDVYRADPVIRLQCIAFVYRCTWSYSSHNGHFTIVRTHQYFLQLLADFRQVRLSGAWWSWCRTGIGYHLLADFSDCDMDYPYTKSIQLLWHFPQMAQIIL